MRRILRFSSTQIVFATRKLALPAGVRDDCCQRRRGRNSANVFGGTDEEDGVLRATQQRNDLVEQPGLNTDVTMLRADMLSQFQDAAIRTGTTSTTTML